MTDFNDHPEHMSAEDLSEALGIPSRAIEEATDHAN